MAGEMITSLKALLSPQMAKYVGSSCSQQLRGTGARGKQGAQEAAWPWPPDPGPALSPGWIWRPLAWLGQPGCVPGLLAPHPRQERLCQTEPERLTWGLSPDPHRVFDQLWSQPFLLHPWGRVPAHSPAL